MDMKNTELQFLKSGLLYFRHKLIKKNRFILSAFFAFTLLVGSSIPVLSFADTAPNCTKCHKDILSGSFEHPAVEAMGCAGCHVKAKGNHKFTLSAPVPELCYGCHEKKNTKKNVHPPVAAGECTYCHNPHSANNKFLLKTRKGIQGPVFIKRTKKSHIYVVKSINYKTAICFSCHADLIKKAHIHSAVKLGKCLTCHHAHESNYDYLLRKPPPVSNTCFTCHSNDLTGRKVIHPAVASGECTNCHNPHSSANKYMLAAKGNQLCYMCHESKEKGKVVHPAIEKYGCIACHDPHATNNNFMLKKPINKLCGTCHPKQKSGYHIFTTPLNKPHPIAGNYTMKSLKGKPLTCVSCHNPHSSNYPDMWYSGNKKLEMCKRCHGPSSKW